MRPFEVSALSDARLVVPLSKLHEPPWGNPKPPIVGKYAEGLDESLDRFGVRDDLKVWPHPTVAGDYVVLDGNQRLSRLRAKGLDAVEVRVLADLDEADAIVFNAGFDRNHADYDELKLADLFRRVDALKPNVAAILRPRIAAVTAPSAFSPPSVASSSVAVAAPNATAADARPSVRPIVFTLTSEGYDAVRATLATATTALRTKKLLESALAGLSDVDAESTVVETALRVVTLRAAVSE